MIVVAKVDDKAENVGTGLECLGIRMLLMSKPNHFHSSPCYFIERPKFPHTSLHVYSVSLPDEILSYNYYSLRS